MRNRRSVKVELAENNNISLRLIAETIANKIQQGVNGQ